MAMDTQAIAAVGFPCTACGGPTRFDADSRQLKCDYCGTDQVIANKGGAPKEHALPDGPEDDEEAVSTDWGVAQQAIQCEQCGGRSLIPAAQTATTCAFCGSPKVLVQSGARGIRPESLIPFHISLSGAADRFIAWKRKRWFVPNAFKKGDINAKLTGIYIPYWTFDANTSSSYSAEVGVYHYRTVTKTRTVNGKTETYTDRERYTVWHSTSGYYDRSFDDVLIPASGQYDTVLLERLGNFDLQQLISYKPEYLSGFIAERYSLSRSDGWKQARERMSETLTKEIRSEIGGDEIRSLRIATDYDDRTYKHLLLPVWNASYNYKAKPYRYMVNGQTGLVSGRVPRSALKITLFVLACVAIVLAALLLYVSYDGSTPS
ncbi:hypothetical protein [Cohnella nanjingensis]|uniref:TFIIB-type zinc ribbon-containing protein n=1 Tax=Cohnella nanjingensis TaxID=1387779 RepID=A0A7X0VFN4_9BACL|nr:hypothetical protein [Cohnella nanjingensis]MBB6671483.1 hypothetical protein [Cohnella nanjingensis]